MGTKATHHVAPIVRGAFLEALERIKLEDKKTYSEIIADWIRGAPINDDGEKPIYSYSGLADVLNAVAKFNVREATVEGNIGHDHKHKHTHVDVSKIDSWIEGLVAGPEDSDTTETLPH